MYTVQTLQLQENITHVHCTDITTLGNYHSCTLYRHYNFRKISLMYTVQTLQLQENITHVHCTAITTVTMNIMMFMVPYSVLFVLYSLSSFHPKHNFMMVFFLDPILNLTLPPPVGYFRGSLGSACFFHKTPLKMQLIVSSFMVRVDKMNIF